MESLLLGVLCEAGMLLSSRKGALGCGEWSIPESQLFMKPRAMFQCFVLSWNLKAEGCLVGPVWGGDAP